VEYQVYSQISDTDIIKNLAARFDALRLSKEMKDEEIIEKSGVSGVTISKFRSGKNITLKTFISLLRSLGEIDRLEAVFPEGKVWTPLASRHNITKKRVRSKKQEKSGFCWGDEQ
jgi:DNA-binding Xre family transcriptional regulator